MWSREIHKILFCLMLFCFKQIQIYNCCLWIKYCSYRSCLLLKIFHIILFKIWYYCTICHETNIAFFVFMQKLWLFYVFIWNFVPKKYLFWMNVQFCVNLVSNWYIKLQNVVQENLLFVGTLLQSALQINWICNLKFLIQENISYLIKIAIHVNLSKTYV